MDGTGAGDGLATLRAGIDQLLSGELSALSSTELTSLVSALEAERRRLEAVDQRLVAELAERGVAGEYGRTSTGDLLVTLLRVSPAEAKARVARARDLGPRHALVGTPLPPLLPIVSAAMRAGEISPAHANVITACVDRIPADIAHEAAPVAEQMLVEAARHEHPGLLAKTAALLLARIDPDGAEPRDRDLERRRDIGLTKYADGSSTVRGRLVPDVTAALETLFDALAAPRPAQDATPDDRTPGQRRHDALGEALMRLLRSDTLPASGGTPVTILATTTIKELTEGVGTARTGHGDQLSIQQLLDMACEAEVIPVVFNDAGGILAFGRARRLASRSQRLVLAARDGGCSFPECDRPAAWTEVHHVLPWIELGTTDVDNMCLLCRFHHREFEKHGWAVQLRDGVPEWIPPPWLDPEQRPRRNTAHHLPDIEFSA
jgi:hypothetical protein